MNLTPKAINALVALKAELLSPSVEREKKEQRPRAAERESRVRMRHARRRGMGFQRFCQRGF